MTGTHLVEEKTLLYSRIVETYQKIDDTTKRLEITKLLVDLLKETPSEIIDKVVYLTQGKLYPDYLGIEIGIAEKLAIKTLAIVTAAKEARIADEYKRRGDLGDAAEALLAGKTQVGLRNERLTVEEVYGILDRIGRVQDSTTNIAGKQSLVDRGEIRHQNSARPTQTRRG